ARPGRGRSRRPGRPGGRGQGRVACSHYRTNGYIRRSHFSCTMTPMAPPPAPAALANLGPLAQLRAGCLPERLLRLVIGLWLYGLSVALMIRGAIGASPWDVFHQG